MRCFLQTILCFIILNSCAFAHARLERDPADIGKGQKILQPRNPISGRGDLTVWKLKEMAEQGRAAELDDLFNHGVSLSALPIGYAAGTSAWVLGDSASPITEALDALTGDYWRGKIFFTSRHQTKTHGLNRVKQDFFSADAPIIPMAAFTAQLLDKHELAPDATSNFVVLEYANPVTKSYWQEEALTHIHVIDVMVAVPGKYGPVYIGKTWLGRYDAQSVFHANDPNRFIAWYFLDFNQGAVDEQLAHHWDGLNEVPIDYANCQGMCVWIAAPARTRRSLRP